VAAAAVRTGVWLLVSQCRVLRLLAVEAAVPLLAGVEDPPLTAVGMTSAAVENSPPLAAVELVAWLCLVSGGLYRMSLGL
jgi:hypothetical protein